MYREDLITTGVKAYVLVYVVDDDCLFFYDGDSTEELIGFRLTLDWRILTRDEYLALPVKGEQLC